MKSKIKAKSIQPAKKRAKIKPPIIMHNWSNFEYNGRVIEFVVKGICYDTKLNLKKTVMLLSVLRITTKKQLLKERDARDKARQKAKEQGK
jgi:hypothetical protein